MSALNPLIHDKHDLFPTHSVVCLALASIAAQICFSFLYLHMVNGYLKDAFLSYTYVWHMVNGFLKDAHRSN